ncbi:PPC domain-containing protein [Verrucomicrobiota bacterium sgz303538]
MPRHFSSLLRLHAPAAVLIAMSIAAYGGSPRVNVVYPSGGQRGAEIEIECRGSNLEDAKTLLFDAPGFESTIISAEKGKFKTKVKVPADARLGEHSFRVITASGIADLKLFYVSPFPLVEEQPEDKANPAKPQPIALGTTVYGHTPNEDQDRYEVELKKGQHLSAEVIGAKLQTQQIYDPALTITKADGTLITEVDDTALGRQDPIASIVAPEDGKYLVTIKESTNSGIGECGYLLHIGSFPRPLAVYPPGGPSGEDLKVQLITDGNTSVEKSVKLPAQPDEKFEVLADGEQPTPTPNYIRVSNMPNVLEAEPNNETAQATAITGGLPIAFNGIIEKKGDIDFFKFTAKKGQAYDLSVFARQLRSPLDSVLAIYDAKGNRIQLNDDDGQPDSHLRWSAPADSDYYLSVKDQLDRGGPLFTYRVEITPVQPKITVWLPEMVINSSQERRAIVVPKGNRYASLVRVKRADVGGDLQLTPGNLPAGVNVIAGAMDKSVDTIPMVFEASDNAAPAAQSFTLAAKLTEPPKDAPTVPSAVQHDVDVAENGNQKAFYSLREDKLPVAVIDEVPVKLTLVQPKVPVLQNGSMNLKVVAERKGDFKGAITLSLLYAPPGIGSPGTIPIKEGENEGILTISANDKAALQKWKVCVVGSADFGKGPVWVSTQLADLEVAAPFTAGQIQRTFVDQGDSTTVTVKLDNKIPFEGKAKVALMGLPPGCTADEQEVTKDDKDVKFTVKSSATSPAGQHRQLFCQFKLTKDGEEMVNNFAQGGILRVDKATVAKNEEKK